MVIVNQDELYLVLVAECLRHELAVTPQQSTNLGQRLCVADGVPDRVFTAADKMFAEYQTRIAKRETQVA